MPARLPPSGALAAAVLLAAAAAAAEPAEAPADRWSVRVLSQTYLRLFERALLPGPGGALVSTELSAPLCEHASLQVADIDLPWEQDSLDVELSVWGDVDPAEAGAGQRVDGDVAVASVRHRLGPAFFRLGRQVQAGGAARLARFDGLAAGARLSWGLGAQAYAGLVVLPRWSERPGYHLLGSAADSLLRSPDALPEPERAGSWLAGGQVRYDHRWLGSLGASFHEERASGELGRRNLGFDLRLTPHESTAVSAGTVVDADAWGLADARALVELRPWDELDLAAEYLRATPALLLSRQSVLSTFSVDAFHELGGLASWRPVRELELGGAGYAQVFATSALGARLVGRARLEPERWLPLVARGEYGFVTEPENGYHALRVALAYRIALPVTATAESYLYFYERPIRDVSRSWVGAANVEWAMARGWSVLGGGSVARTPYAAIDAQAIARLRLELDWSKP
ncbi:MAG: hypothetical protein HY744_24605 [Deltaproteobacteria bacterium]|nr:hypothetical protein [Deltaproteobacteria bacterium]